MPLWCEEERVSTRDNGDRVSLGSSGAYETSATTPGELYRLCLKEYGRCTGRVYVDRENGPTLTVGWVFLKRMPYEDDPRHSSIIETWVTVLKGPDSVKRTKHYHAIEPAPRQRFVRRLPCSCKRKGLQPETTTCGACSFAWCDRCNPAPSARCWNEVNHIEV